MSSSFIGPSPIIKKFAFGISLSIFGALFIYTSQSSLDTIQQGPTGHGG